MNKKITFITLTLISLCAAIANASNPASKEYVQQYVQAQIAKIPAGPQGPIGPAGPVGPPGPAGALDFADFFALMPGDNAAAVTPGSDVQFPQDGPASGTGLITRIGASSFNLADIGTYQVQFQVSVTEPGQLELTLNLTELPYTVVGRASGTAQIVGVALVQTTSINSILTVRNPVANSLSLTITPLAGGSMPVSAHLVITRLK